MSRLPRTPGDRHGSTKGGRLRPSKAREVKSPDLYVKLAERGYYTEKYAQARIRIRKGCYLYLVWRDGERTCEFYLGKRKTDTPQGSAGDVELGRGRRILQLDRMRGTK